MSKTYHHHGTTGPASFLLVVAGALALLIISGVVAAAEGLSIKVYVLWGLAALFIAAVLPLWGAEFVEPESTHTAPLDHEHGG